MSCEGNDVRISVNVETRVLSKVEAEDNLVRSWKWGDEEGEGKAPRNGGQDRGGCVTSR